MSTVSTVSTVVVSSRAEVSAVRRDPISRLTRRGRWGHRRWRPCAAVWLVVALLVGMLAGGFGVVAPVAGQQARTIVVALAFPDVSPQRGDEPFCFGVHGASGEAVGVGTQCVDAAAVAAGERLVFDGVPSAAEYRVVPEMYPARFASVPEQAIAEADFTDGVANVTFTFATAQVPVTPEAPELSRTLVVTKQFTAAPVGDACFSVVPVAAARSWQASTQDLQGAPEDARDEGVQCTDVAAGDVEVEFTVGEGSWEILEVQTPANCAASLTFDVVFISADSPEPVVYPITNDCEAVESAQPTTPVEPEVGAAGTGATEPGSDSEPEVGVTTGEGSAATEPASDPPTTPTPDATESAGDGSGTDPAATSSTAAGDDPASIAVDATDPPLIRVLPRTGVGAPVERPVSLAIALALAAAALTVLSIVSLAVVPRGERRARRETLGELRGGAWWAGSVAVPWLRVTKRAGCRSASEG